MSPESGMVLTDHSRLQRYFVDPKEAKLMRWHAERKKPDDGDDPKLRHVKDGSQWRALNNLYRYFECDARNIVLGACTDGMNPFGNQNTNHSTWPMFVWMYNIPLVVHEIEVHSHEHAYSRAEQPGNNINLYLGLL